MFHGMSPSRINSGVIIKSNIKQYDIHGSIKLSDANNISGELLSALIGINLAVDLGFSELNIIYSYLSMRAKSENMYIDTNKILQG